MDIAQFLDIFIILGCFLVFYLFKRTKSYISPNGLLLLVLPIALLLIKLLTTGNPSELGFRTDNIGDTLLPTIVFVILGAAVLTTMRYKPKRFKVLKWLVSFVLLYLAFGVIQQFFFQALFAHTLYLLLKDKLLTIVFASIFFSSFHWGWDAKGIRFGLLTLFAGIVFPTLYLKSPNLILLGAAHAVMASLYYFIVYEDNVLEKRLSTKGKKTLLKFLHH